MHFSKLAAVTTLVGLAAAETYLVKLGHLVGGDVLTTSFAQVAKINQGDSALIIRNRPKGENAEHLFYFNSATGEFSYRWPSIGAKVGVTVAPPAAKLVLGGPYSGVVAFVPKAGMKHTLNGQAIGVQDAGHFSVEEDESAPSSYPFSLKLEGKTFAYCKYAQTEVQALVAVPAEDSLPGKCEEAYVFLRKYVAPLVETKIPDVDVSELDN